MKQILLATFAIITLFLPLFASARDLPNVWDPGALKGPLVTCWGGPVIFDNTGTPQDNPNACTNLCDLVFTILNDIYVAIAFVIWIVLPFSFMVGGIMYMMGGANPGLLTSAKSTLKGAVIGTVVVLCAYLLIAALIQFVNITNIGGFNGAPACKISSSS
jgi:hypothetical protein